MCFLPDQAENRREFFRAAARYGLLAVLTAASAVVARRANGQRCINRGICRGCAAFAGCELPAALSAKQAQANGGPV